MFIVVACVAYLLGVGREDKTGGAGGREHRAVITPGRDVGVGASGYVVHDDVPIFAIAIFCPMAEKQFVCHVRLYGVLFLLVHGRFVGFAVRAANLGENLRRESYEFAVWRERWTLDAERVVGDFLC